MCLICRLGTREMAKPAFAPLRRILQAMKKDPRAAFTLRTLIHHPRASFPKDGTPGSLHFNILRDIRLFEKTARKSKLTPGCTMPAGELVYMILSTIKSTSGICAFDKETSEAWRGCPLAGAGQYERGCKKALRLLASLLPGFFRSQKERDRVKRTSAASTLAAKSLAIFPNHTCCITCHYSLGLDFVEPNVLHHDNLFEVAEAMRRNPDIPVTLVSKDCMVCPPCGALDTKTGLCHISFAPGRRAQVKASYPLLQALGLKVGDTLPAGKLMRRLYDNVTTTVGNCGDDRCNSPERFDRGRQAGLGFLDAYENPAQVIARVAKLLASPAIRRLLSTAEREAMAETTRKAAIALKAGKRDEAYQLLISRAFWNCWKTYLEKADVSAARLPRSLPTESPDSPHCLEAVRVRGKILCDGRLNENDWRAGTFSAGFRTTGSRHAVSEMAVKSLHDNENLYFAIACADQDTRRLKADARTGEEIMYKLTPWFEEERAQGMGAYPWHESDDALAVFVQPSKRTPVYYQFICNARGVNLAQRFVVGPAGRTVEICRDLPWSVGMKLTRKLWSVEMVIPWRALGVRPSKGKRLGINFHRVFGQELISPRIRFKQGGSGFAYVERTRPINPICRVLRAPESWSFSPGNPWHDQLHDLASFGRLEIV